MLQLATIRNLGREWKPCWRNYWLYQGILGHLIPFHRSLWVICPPTHKTKVPVWLCTSLCGYRQSLFLSLQLEFPHLLNNNNSKVVHCPSFLHFTRLLGHERMNKRTFYKHIINYMHILCGRTTASTSTFKHGEVSSIWEQNKTKQNNDTFLNPMSPPGSLSPPPSPSLFTPKVC